MSRMKDLEIDVRLRGPIAAGELIASKLSELGDDARRALISADGLVVGPCAVWFASDLRAVVAFVNDERTDGRTASVPIDPPAWARRAPDIGRLREMMGADATDADAQRMLAELESAGWVSRFDGMNLMVEPDEDAWLEMLRRACEIDD